MDRGNGGDLLAPPRPPKSLPRVHRPRAPEPTMMSASLTPILQPRQQQQQVSRSNSAVSTISSTSNIINNNSTSTTQNRIPVTAPLIPLHPNSTANFLNLSNNNISSNNLSTPITPTNSFTRRRPPPPILNLSLLPSSHNQQHSSNLLNNNNNNNNNNHNNNNNSNNINNNILEIPTTPVTLAAPRPENERLANEYVDTPFNRTSTSSTNTLNASTTTTVQLHLHNASRNQHPAGQTIHGQTTTQHNLLHSQRQQLHQQQDINQHIHISHSNNLSNNQQNSTSISGIVGDGDGGVDGGSSTILHSQISHKCSSKIDNKKVQQTNCRQQQLLSNQRTTTPITQPITKQPVSFTKDTSDHSDDLDIHHIGPLQSNTIGGINTMDALNSITCPQCKKCRCEQCQSPRQLPSRWVCNKTCLCSAETIIDYASCLCCVKALFYHCSKDHEMECDGDEGESISCADDPCSCLPHKRAQRWGWLGALSIALPCLWCYWPMRGCIAVCAKCYARHARHGCKCNHSSQIGSTSSMLPIIQIGNNGSSSNNRIIHHHQDSHGKGSGGNGNNHGINGTNNNSSIGRLIRPSDLTTEKRLLDPSPEH